MAEPARDRAETSRGAYPHLSEAARSALEQPRFEVVPIKGALEQAARLPSGAEVSITCSPTLGIENTLALAEKLSNRGFRVVPHVSARLVTGEDHLKKILRRLDDSRLRDIFVVGGDAKEPAGPFASGLELLRAMSRLEHGIQRVGIPAYPEGHPLVGEKELTRALLDKQKFASYMVTQICFDPEVILGWLRDVRRRGIELPAYIGLPGAMDRGKLLRISLKIGIGESVRYLRKQRGLIGRLLFPGGYNPEALVGGLAPHVGDTVYRIQGFHFNTFNQVESTERWRREVLGSSGVEENQGGPRPTQGVHP